jgi:hypothetical protein
MLSRLTYGPIEKPFKSMKQFINPSLPILLCLFVIIAVPAKANNYHHKTPGYNKIKSGALTVKAFSKEFVETADSLYNEIDLKEAGLSLQAFEYALRGYVYLQQHHLLGKCNVLSICDFSQSSRNKRMYVVDLDQKKILINTYVAHGRKSGSEFAKSFSNSMQSHKSSLGFYITDKTYYGEHGLALKIRGLEQGINNHAFARNIVVHGSDYVGSDFIKMNKFNGRSFGCPAVPASEVEDLIETIKEGTCLFIYHPTKKYLGRSKILKLLAWT